MSETMSSRIVTGIASTALASALLLVASPAFGQDVRRYGDETSESEGGGGGGQSSGSRMVYPGQPMPQTDQQSRGQRRRRGSASQKESERNSTTGSYEIRVHEPKKQMERGRLRERKLLNKAAEKMYQGIIPGKRDRVEHLGEDEESGTARSGANKLTWIGFQPDEERTRVFVQTARTPEYSVRTEDEGRRLVVTLERTEFSARNFRREIDASYFDRVVRRIETEATGEATIELRLSLRSEASPSVQTEKNYLYIDFPHQSAGDDASNDSDEQ